MNNNLQFIIICITIVFVCICSVFQPILLILLVGAFAYIIYNRHKNKQQPNVIITEPMIHSIYGVALRIFSKLENQLLIDKPTDISDVCPYDSMIVTKQGLPFIQTKVRLKVGNKEDETTIPANNLLIQKTLNKALIAGELDGLLNGVRSANGHDPILVIESSHFENGFLVVVWAVLDNIYTYNYLLFQRFSVRNNSVGTATVSKTDKDF